MTQNRRLLRELNDLREQGIKCFEFQVREDNLSVWDALILPDSPPYNKGAFKLQITFPKDYPFKPPKIKFKTRIYHPNIDDNGDVCLQIINVEHWKPATRIHFVITSLIRLIDYPEPSHPLKTDLAEEYETNKSRFMKNAEEFTKKFAEKRPSDRELKSGNFSFT